jgi:hypothetical protein
VPLEALWGPLGWPFGEKNMANAAPSY